MVQGICKNQRLFGPVSAASALDRAEISKGWHEFRQLFT
jgi:hypothetical protein